MKHTRMLHEKGRRVLSQRFQNICPSGLILGSLETKGCSYGLVKCIHLEKKMQALFGVVFVGDVEKIKITRRQDKMLILKS